MKTMFTQSGSNNHHASGLLVSALLLAGGATLFTGCPQEEPEPTLAKEGEMCQVAADCESGLTCRSQVCTPLNVPDDMGSDSDMGMDGDMDGEDDMTPVVEDEEFVISFLRKKKTGEERDNTYMYTVNTKSLDVVRASNADALFAVDGITSVGVHPVPMDEWGIDILVSGSQKAFAVPPGVSFLAANERAWARAKESDHYKYYFDLLREKKKQEGSGQTAFTPAISVILALDVVLQMMREEGLESIWARHEQHSRAMIAAWEAMGGAGFAEVPTHCVSAVRMPEGVDAVKLRALLRDKYGVLVAGAYNEFKPHVLRVGHLGQVHSGEVMAGLAAIEAALLESGARFKQGAGLSAAQIVYTGAMNTEKK